MKLNLTPANHDSLNSDTQIGWGQMPKFGDGYLQYLAGCDSADELPALPSTEISAQDMISQLYTQPEVTGWSEVASNVRQSLQESFWMSMTAAACLANA
jgi:hypothetical protein